MYLMDFINLNIYYIFNITKDYIWNINGNLYQFLWFFRSILCLIISWFIFWYYLWQINFIKKIFYIYKILYFVEFKNQNRLKKIDNYNI